MAGRGRRGAASRNDSAGARLCRSTADQRRAALGTALVRRRRQFEGGGRPWAKLDRAVVPATVRGSWAEDPRLLLALWGAEGGGIPCSKMLRHNQPPLPANPMAAIRAAAAGAGRLGAAGGGGCAVANGRWCRVRWSTPALPGSAESPRRRRGISRQKPNWPCAAVCLESKTVGTPGQQ